jgi:hypothetical protein
MMFIRVHNPQAINQKYEIKSVTNSYDFDPPVIVSYLLMAVGTNFSSMEIKCVINVADRARGARKAHKIPRTYSPCDN